MEYIFYDRQTLIDAFTSWMSAKLPQNIVIKANSPEGIETLKFVLSLNDVQLSKLKKEAERHHGEVQLSFGVQSTTNDCSKPVDITKYPWRNSKKILFNGVTSPTIDEDLDLNVNYVSVIFVE